MVAVGWRLGWQEGGRRVAVGGATWHPNLVPLGQKVFLFCLFVCRAALFAVAEFSELASHKALTTREYLDLLLARSLRGVGKEPAVCERKKANHYFSPFVFPRWEKKLP